MTVACVLSIVGHAMNVEEVEKGLQLRSGDSDPPTPADWQVLLSGYAPLALYAALCVVGRVVPRVATRGAAVTG